LGQRLRKIKRAVDPGELGRKHAGDEEKLIALPLAVFGGHDAAVCSRWKTKSVREDAAA